MIAWQISQLDPRWDFHPKGGGTPDLSNASGQVIQVKATSNKSIKGNRVSANQGYYIAVKYTKKGPFSIEIREIRMGELTGEDWHRPSGTQWAILKPEAEERMRRIYP